MRWTLNNSASQTKELSNKTDFQVGMTINNCKMYLPPEYNKTLDTDDIFYKIKGVSQNVVRF